MRRLRRFALRWRQISPTERRLFGEAVWRLANARRQTRANSFQRLAASLVAPVETGRGSPNLPCLADAVRRAAGVVPFRALCFEQALALHAMATARGTAVTLHYGLARGEGEGLSGHVWVSHANRVILGDAVRENFKEVAMFPLGRPTDARLSQTR